jgi:DNA repair exonuclease SbcCD ATPase subunit
MLSINYLKFDNFITYRDQTFNFSELFMDSPIVLIYGQNFDDTFANDNGAGKSIIYEGLLFTLFNKTTKNSNKDSLIGKFSKSMSTECELLDSANNKFWIKRYRKNKIYGNGVRFKINGKERAKGTSRELTNLILNTLGITYKRVMNTSVFESNDERSRFVYLGDKEGKALLSQIKGLDIFLKCSEISNEKFKESEAKIINMENTLNNHKTFLDRINNEIKELTVLSEDFEINRKAEIFSLKTSIRAQKGNITKTKLELEKTTNEFKDQISKSEELIAELEDIEELNKKIKGVNKVIIGLSKELSAIITNIERNDKHLFALKSQPIGAKCDYCGSIISEIKVDKHIANIKKTNNKLDFDRKVLEEMLLSAENKKSHLEGKLAYQTNQDHSNREIRMEIKKLQNRITDAKTFYSKSTQQSRKVLISLNERMGKVRESKNTYSTRISKLKKEKLTIQLKVKSSLEELKKLKERYKYDKSWVMGYGKEGIQSYALESTAVREFNEQVKRISGILTDGMVDIELLTEKKQGNKKIRNIFELKISDLHKKGLPFKEWSKGQKKRIEVMTSFALMNLEDNLISEVFLDELFDGIDEIGINRIINLLEREAEEMGKRFVVFSHSKEIKNLFTTKAYVKLKDGISSFYPQ